jgi:prepilin-type N-terminal cleavage/methylation domain-containing protein
MEKGFTLIEVLITIFLTSIVFLGIFGAFYLTTKVISHTRIKMQAVFLATQKIEEVRSLSFENIETMQETIVLNNVSYQIERLVENYDDCFDGTIEGFDCQNNPIEADLAPDDYKKIKINVFWDASWGGEVSLSTIAASKSLETGEGKGAIKITVSTSLGEPIEVVCSDQLAPCPETAINIINQGSAFNQCYGTSDNNPGTRLLILDSSLEPDDYKIKVQKQGYGEAETFQSGDSYNGEIIATPLRKNPTINEGQFYPLTLTIDKLSDLDIYTLAPGSGDRFFDSFFNGTKIFDLEDLKINQEKVSLSTSSAVSYQEDGYLISNSIEPISITEWDYLTWSDFEEVETSIKYHLLCATGSSWALVPDLIGNEEGFSIPPIDISSLSVIDYPKLRIKADFFTTDLAKTPLLYDWQISWKNGQDTVVPDVYFDVKGEDIVGWNSLEEEIYEYQKSFSTDASGYKRLEDIKPDKYYFSNFLSSRGALNIREDLTELPISLAPNISTTTNFYLDTGNSLFVQVKDAENDNPIFGTDVSLSSNSLGYNVQHTTNEQGTALFILLQESADYQLEVESENYYSQTIELDIYSSQNEFVNLDRYE